MGNAKKFFEEVAKTEEAKAIFSTMKKPETEEEIIAAYVDVANKLGVALTTEEAQAYLTSDKTGSAELDDEELSQLAGGGDPEECFSTFQHRENCILSDACDNFYIEYIGYYCDTYSRDGSGMR
jgi:hypothetical protein